MSDRLTLGQLLRWGTEVLRRAGLEEPQLEAAHLLASLLGTDRGGLYGSLVEGAAPAVIRGFQRAIKLRRRRWPAAYITGWRQFLDFSVKTDARALIPRPETELLVEAALEMLDRLNTAEPVVADIGTGSGVIAIALARRCPSGHLLATDISADALDLARENALRLGVGGQIRFYRGDLIQPLREAGWAGKIDLVVSNPPYIAEERWGELPPEVVLHEPPLALAGGRDGLAFYRRLAQEVPAVLGPGGGLALEIGSEQAVAVTELLDAAGFTEVEVRKDYAGHDRVVLAWLGTERNSFAGSSDSR